MGTDGFTSLLKMIKKINSDAIAYNEGIGTFDIGTIDNEYNLSTITIVQPLKPEEYLVSSNLLKHSTESLINGAWIEDTEQRVKTRFTPGEYLVAYVNNTPIVLTKLVRGVEAVG